MASEPFSSDRSARLRALAERLVREALAAQDVPDLFENVSDDVLHRFVAGAATADERASIEGLVVGSPDFAAAVSHLSSADDTDSDELPEAIRLPLMLSPSASSAATDVNWQSEWNACRQELARSTPVRTRRWAVAASLAATLAILLFSVDHVRIRSRVYHLEHAQLARQTPDNSEMLRMRLEHSADQEFIGVVAANLGNTSEDGMRLVSTAGKIRQWEIEQNIPQLVAVDKPLVRFDQVVQRYATRLSSEAYWNAVNVETYPKASDHPEQVTEYFYAQWALNILRSKMSQALMVNDFEKDAIVALIHANQDARSGLWRGLSAGRRYVAIRTDFDKDGSGTVTFDWVDAEARLVKSEEFAFLHSPEPVPLRRRFNRQDYEAGGEVDIRNGDSADEMVVSFSGAEAASHRVSLMTHDEGVPTSAIGNLAYLCFETKVEDKSARATVGFTTGGFGGDLVAAGLPPQSYTNKWQPVRIPVDLKDASLWRTGLTITVLGNLPDGKSVNVHVRNGYIQPIGGPVHVHGVEDPI